MKKIIALVVAIIMMASISVVAFADDRVQNDKITVTDVQEGGLDIGNGTQLKYTVSLGYVVTIPADTDFDPATLKTDGTIALSAVKLPADKQVQVQINSDWTLEDENDTSEDVKYGAYLADVEKYVEGENSGKLATGAVVISANMIDNVDASNPLVGASKNATIYFATEGTSQVGIYTDIITFTSFVVDYPTPSEAE